MDDDIVTITQAWADLCDALKAAGAQVLDLAPPHDPGGLEVAEGYRYLARLTRAAFELGFETAGPDAPRLESAYPYRVSFAQRNPDQVYLSARVSGAHEYRISGRRNPTGVLSFMTRASGGADTPEGLTGFLDAGDLHVGDDGTFAVTVSVEPRAGNWLPMTDATDSLLVRERFDDPDGEPSDLWIDRIDEVARLGTDPGPTSLDPAQATRALQGASLFVHGILGRFGDWTRRAAQHPNRFLTDAELFGSGDILQVGGSPAIDYRLGYWTIGPDEAVVLDFTPPAGARWGFQVMNHWQENLGLPYCGSHRNAATAPAHADGSVRLVIAPRDPGTANWIATDGHHRGVMLFRWFGEPRGTDPVVRLVRLDAVERAAAPPGTDLQGRVAPGYRLRRFG